MLSFQQLSLVTNGDILQFLETLPVVHLLTDSRKVAQPSGSLFFAIKGNWNDGHNYIPALYKAGVRQFVVEEQTNTTGTLWTELCPEANLLQVQSSLQALQQVACWHREQFWIPVIGITGSNGKTIVKEWLSQLLSPDELVAKSPRSYNSQLGVPLSVWQLNHSHTLGIFEAGISQPHEMEHLQQVIQPTLGIFTNVGTAHDEGFASRAEKIDEKLKLFEKSDLLFYCADHEELHQAVQAKGVNAFTWSREQKSDLSIIATTVSGQKTIVVYNYQGKEQRLAIPFTDDASVENLLHCLAILLYRELPLAEIQARIDRLHPVAMRLEMKEGINGCYLIDDTYNNDIGGLEIALSLLAYQPKRGKNIVILSDLLESGLPEKRLYTQVADLVAGKGVDRVIGIGPTISKYAGKFRAAGDFYQSTEAFLNSFNPDSFRNELILVKGARVFGFERIVHAFQQKVHGTVLEVNLDALVHNLNYYRSKLAPSTKLMVMVKAFAYGSGSFEVANLLQFHRADYLAVAYADEGIMLRENGITLPVMVMNPSSDSFTKLLRFNLEPEIYSLELLKSFIKHLPEQGTSSVHLKLDTGMHRLGLTEEDLDELFELLKQHPTVQVVSAFTHLAGADEAVHNSFSQNQIITFKNLAEILEVRLGYTIIKHVLNSAGIIRFPEHQLDMVRLGIGLYGVEASGADQDALRSVSTLKTTVSQVKKVKQGDTVGYSRKGIANSDKTIATIAIGYADGYDRRFSNGAGYVLINGKRSPVIGNVCMDMCMVDVTGQQVKAGDEVIVFGPQLPLTALAQEIGTIPYEILTNVSSRVKRIFYSE